MSKNGAGLAPDRGKGDADLCSFHYFGGHNRFDIPLITVGEIKNFVLWVF
jgi:hypothetical protein